MVVDVATLPRVSETADRIERFLLDNPRGTLWVVAGYASTYGFAWLHERTQARPVRVLVGDIGTFQGSSPSDRAAAVQFLQRPDVAVGTIYGRTVHAKGWMVEPDPAAGVAGGVLHGSANLTKSGLHHNVELMSEVASGDIEELRAKIRDTVEQGQSVKVGLLERLGAPLASVSADASKDSPRSHRGQGSSMVRQLAKSLGLIIGLIVGALLVVRFVLPLLGLLSDALAPDDGSVSSVSAPASPAPSVAGEPSVGTEAVTEATVTPPVDAGGDDAGAVAAEPPAARAEMARQ